MAGRKKIAQGLLLAFIMTVIGLVAAYFLLEEGIFQLGKTQLEKSQPENQRSALQIQNIKISNKQGQVLGDKLVLEGEKDANGEEDGHAYFIAAGAAALIGLLLGVTMGVPRVLSGLRNANEERLRQKQAGKTSDESETLEKQEQKDANHEVTEPAPPLPDVTIVEKSAVEAAKEPANHELKIEPAPQPENRSEPNLAKEKPPVISPQPTELASPNQRLIAEVTSNDSVAAQENVFFERFPTPDLMPVMNKPKREIELMLQPGVNAALLRQKNCTANPFARAIDPNLRLQLKKALIQLIDNHDSCMEMFVVNGQLSVDSYKEYIELFARGLKETMESKEGVAFLFQSCGFEVKPEEINLNPDWRWEASEDDLRVTDEQHETES